MASGLVLTAVGAAAIEAAYNAGEVVEIIDVQLGDGGGVPVDSDPATEALVNKFGTEPFSSANLTDELFSGSVVIGAKKYPGQVIRELGLISADGVLIAYGGYPETYFPLQEDAVTKSVTIYFTMPIVHAESVTILVDPSVSILTVEAGDDRYLNEDANLSDLENVEEARTNLELGNAATHDVQSSPTDTASGAVLMNGAWGIGSSGITMKDSDILSPTGIGNAFFVQGGGADNHFGSYGAGVHLSYGTGGGNTVRLSANLFVEPTGNLSVEWLEINLSDGSVKNQKLQKLYGPLNKPTSDTVDAIMRDECHIAGFVSGNEAKPYMRHTASNAVVQLLPITTADNRYIQNTQMGAEEYVDIPFPGQADLPFGACPTAYVGATKPTGGGVGFYISRVYFRRLQKYIGGSWVNVA